MKDRPGCAALPLAVVLAFVGLGSPHARANTIVYVNHAAPGANDGTSWSDAWNDLQDALSSVPGEVQIWVAAGMYRPGTSRSDTFRLVSGVTIYGGLAGTENPDMFDLADRDYAINETILDGRIGAEGSADNIHHVVTGSGTGASAVLDGFTITGACANGATTLLQDVGGGLLNVNGSPKIRNCLFLSNHAGWGGAIYNSGDGQPALINCRFIGNTASMDGGALFSSGAESNVTTPLLLNCLFSGNRSLGGDGGAVFNTIGSRMTMINTTLSGNIADGEGGGVFHEYGLMTLMNCIVWGNEDRGPTDQSAQLGGGLPTARYCCIQGLTDPLANYNNIGDDPLFVDAAGPDGVVGTRDDDLHPAAGSPCIDAGTNEAVVSGVPFDLDGNPRIVDDPATPDTGYPPDAPAIIDIGAYELQEPCDVDADCDDGDPCTDDACEQPAGWCVHTNIDCDDGVFCNGRETCAGGECQAGTPPDCGDGIACTADTCDPAADSCTHIPDDSLCDNGLYCDGVETCHVLSGCLAGTAIDCDDGIDCTDDVCDEDTETCFNTPVDQVCDDGLFCNGPETCDAASDCQSGFPPCDAQLVCNEEADVCVGCLVDTQCDDGLFCNGAETCEGGQCEAGDDPCPGQTCDEVSSVCVVCLTGADCDDDIFCNGEETCIGSTCVMGTAPCNAGDICDEQADECKSPPQCQGDSDCGDINPCTNDHCHEGNCQYTDNTASCDDGDSCTTGDTCSGGSCVGTPIPGCGSPPPPPPPPTDSDGDGVPNANDRCPRTPQGEEVDATGCSCSQLDNDSDGVNNCDDACPEDPEKTEPGQCGCGSADTDSDGDATADCRDPCKDDPDKIQPGICGCGVSDVDTDGDGTADCKDECPEDLEKTAPGICGCDVAEVDSDTDGVPDCHDLCPETTVGVQVEADGCPLDPLSGQTIPDVGEGDTSNGDGDGDGIADEYDLCPETPIDTVTDEDGCPLDAQLDDTTALSPTARSCGSCGAFGMITWTLLFATLLGLRLRVTDRDVWGQH